MVGSGLIKANHPGTHHEPQLDRRFIQGHDGSIGPADDLIPPD
jgi:hypothetical protein